MRSHGWTFCLQPRLTLIFVGNRISHIRMQLCSASSHLQCRIPLAPVCCRLQGIVILATTRHPWAHVYLWHVCVFSLEASMWNQVRAKTNVRRMCANVYSNAFVFLFWRCIPQKLLLTFISRYALSSNLSNISWYMNPPTLGHSKENGRGLDDGNRYQWRLRRPLSPLVQIG